jgi:S-formylglutathione hydrolase
LVDQGTKDVLIKQLQPELLIEATKHLDIEIRMQEGHDHYYPFVNAFIADHIVFHAKHLNAQGKL